MALTGRRRRLPNGERRDERAPSILWSRSELDAVTRAAHLRGQSVGAFVAQAAHDVAVGRRSADVAGVDVDTLATLRDVGRLLMDVRRQLSGAANNLNQLTAAKQSGVDVRAAQEIAVLTHVRTQLVKHDTVAGRLADVLGRLR